MKPVNPDTIDLNLLKTFLAIWDLRSLKLAADRLHLSAPAVSHALKRLREVFDDPLFVRTTTAMVPTDAALRLHGPIEAAINLIHSALQNHSRFDPGLSTRTFRLTMSDVAEQYTLPRLMEILGAEAPHVKVEIKQMRMDDLCPAMRNGDLDVAFGYLPVLDEECVAYPLFDDEFVCIVRRAHPFAGRQLSLDGLRALNYVYAETRMTGHWLAESALQAAGVHCEIALKLPHYTVAAQVAASSNLALMIPRRAAQALNDRGQYELFDLPLQLPPIKVKVYTHSRFSHDLGVSWLASLLVRMFGGEEAGEDCAA